MAFMSSPIEQFLVGTITRPLLFHSGFPPPTSAPTWRPMIVTRVSMRLTRSRISLTGSFGILTDFLLAVVIGSPALAGACAASNIAGGFDVRVLRRQLVAHIALF